MLSQPKPATRQTLQSLNKRTHTRGWLPGNYRSPTHICSCWVYLVSGSRASAVFQFALFKVVGSPRQRGTWQLIISTVSPPPAGWLMTDITMFIWKGFSFKVDSLFMQHAGRETHTHTINLEASRWFDFLSLNQEICVCFQSESWTRVTPFVWIHYEAVRRDLDIYNGKNGKSCSGRVVQLRQRKLM